MLSNGCGECDFSLKFERVGGHVDIFHLSFKSFLSFEKEILVEFVMAKGFFF